MIKLTAHNHNLRKSAITLLNEVLLCPTDESKDASSTLAEVDDYKADELISTINWCLDALKEHFSD